MTRSSLLSVVALISCIKCKDRRTSQVEVILEIGAELHTCEFDNPVVLTRTKGDNMLPGIRDYIPTLSLMPLH
jgi:hypothetical protein